MTNIHIKRTRLSYFTDEIINLDESGNGIFRHINQFEPEKDIKKTVNSNRHTQKVIKFIKDNKSFEFRADGMSDGVSYEVRYNSKIWWLFCPEQSDDQSVKELGNSIDKIINKMM